MKGNPEAMSGMNPPEGMFNLQVSSTSNDEGDTMGGMGSPTNNMGGMGSPTAMQGAPGADSEMGNTHKTHPHPHSHRKGQKNDPQPQGHDLRHHHGYNLRASK